MSLRCLLALSTVNGKCYAVVSVNTLDQLAMVMPAPVLAYEVEQLEEAFSPAKISDTELYEELVHIIVDSKDHGPD